jgi:hypothetical protein
MANPTPGPSLAGTPSFVEESIYITKVTDHPFLQEIPFPEKLSICPPHQLESSRPSISFTGIELQTLPNASAGNDRAGISLPSSFDAERSVASLAFLTLTIDSPPPDPEFMKREGTSSTMTRTLKRLVSHKDFTQRYHPVREIRQPKTWERGYWRIDTEDWPAQTQLVFWKFLEGFVGKGKAGIGTSCKRNMLDDGSVELGPHSQLGVVRIYCWGELVKPLFLLAHLGSKGFTKKVGAQWISAATSEVVIEMP